MGKITIGSVFLGLLSMGLQAETFLPVDRYSSVRLGATETQLDPLRVIVQLRFPSLILNTRQAIDYALEDSGYSLVEREFWTPEMEIMMMNSLGMVHRDFTNSPMELRELLGVIAGQHFRVVQDPLRRQISFVLKDKYRGLIDG